MTVAELIAELQKMPQETDVVIDSDYGPTYYFDVKYEEENKVAVIG